MVDVIWRQLRLHETTVRREARCLCVLACGEVNDRLGASGGGLRRKRTSGKGEKRPEAAAMVAVAIESPSGVTIVESRDISRMARNGR